MTYRTAKYICLLVAASLAGIVGLSTHAATVYYALDNLVLDDETQMTGIFSWIYTEGDFENGVGEFITLEIPWTPHNQDDLIARIEVAQIEITFDGNVHDDGVDIKLVLQSDLTPNTSSLINTNAAESKYSIGGNQGHKGRFLSGSITPTNSTLNIVAVSNGFFSVSWEPELPGVVLQETPNLSTNWLDSANGSTNPVIVPVTAPTMFYRLVNP